MAKKIYSKAIKKLDEQISDLKNSSLNSDDSVTPVVTKKELKEGIEKKSKSATKSGSTKKKTTKKSTTTKKTSTTKTSKTKRTTTKKTTRKKEVKDDVIVVPSKTEKKKSTVKKIDKALRDDIVVTPNDSSKKKITKKKEEKKEKAEKDEVVVVNDDVKDSSLENDKLDEYKFVSELEEDITNGKYIDKAKALIDKANKKSNIKRKRKGKNKYIIDLESTREYQNLERDLRSLYDKTNDIIDEIDSNKINEDTKTVDVISDIVISDTNKKEKKGLLDYLNQKVLNVIIAILLAVFIIMLIVVIGIVIYVSTV